MSGAFFFSIASKLLFVLIARISIGRTMYA